MVGCLFAFNAMLITAPERRRFIADLRIQGFEPRQIVTILLFEATLLGVGASLAGLVLGDLLSRVLFDKVPEYLAFAFPVGTQQVVEPMTVALALAGGLAASLLASLRPLLDLRRRQPVDAVFHERGEPGEMISTRATRILFACGLLLIAVTTLVVSVAPAATIVGGVTLAVATLLVTPVAFTTAGRGVAALSRRSRRFNMVAVAMLEVQSTRTRSLGLVAHLRAGRLRQRRDRRGARGPAARPEPPHDREPLDRRPLGDDRRQRPHRPTASRVHSTCGRSGARLGSPGCASTAARCSTSTTGGCGSWADRARTAS